MLPYRRRVSSPKRREQYERVRSTHPKHVPIVMERYHNTTPFLKKEKFLVPEDLTFAHLIQTVRLHMDDLDASQSIFLFTGSTIVNPRMTVSLAYSQWAEADGFLYVTYSLENVFG